MGRLIVWVILVGIFLLSGYGLNLIRIAIIDKIANPEIVIWWKVLIGGVLMVGGLSFLGGFIFYRDRKRNKVRPPAWKTK
ncbi:DUF2627 family protein [Tumebacillus flagellatus]|uniref:DUF2627 domain-containing protein n=1 Tax=Tumebacillus flagellatus TaxID=1157490 RepID=A0A074LMJ6_9BACL|nr:DUF2627 family protein [Tumebacillus flagellatus]KEO82354.1 hypothetical protein EL26_15630 [Tumebacillus flagellatus]